jgi:hypothetical protein
VYSIANVRFRVQSQEPGTAAMGAELPFSDFVRRAGVLEG